MTTSAGLADKMVRCIWWKLRVRSRSSSRASSTAARSGSAPLLAWNGSTRRPADSGEILITGASSSCEPWFSRRSNHRSRQERHAAWPHRSDASVRLMMVFTALQQDVHCQPQIASAPAGALPKLAMTFIKGVRLRRIGPRTARASQSDGPAVICGLHSESNQHRRPCFR